MSSILCVVEFDNYPEQVVARATWLAKLHGGDLHLLVSDQVTDFLGDSYVYLLETQDIADSIREFQEGAIAKLLDAVEEPSSSHVEVECLIGTQGAAREPATIVR